MKLGIVSYVLVVSMNLFMLATSRYDGTVGLVWFGRPEIPAAEYAPLLAALAAQSPSGLVTEPAGSDPEAAVRTLREKHVAKVVIASHSMESKAGVAAQDFTFSRAVDLNISSLVLISGFLQRKQRPGLVKCASLASIKPQRSLHYPLGHLGDGVHDCSREMTAVAFPVPVLTVGGELDGLVRIGRIAEAAYTQRSDSDRFPVVLIEEMTHSAVLSNATIPGDVPAVITQANRSEIRANVAKAFGTFVNANNAINTTLRAHTDTLLAPLVEALVEQEGSWWLTGGVDDEHGSSSWAAQAQRMVVEPLPEGWGWADGPNSSTNAFHLLSDEDKIPPYYRHKHRANVTIASSSAKTLASSTVAQLRYVKVSVTQAGIGLDGYSIIKEEKCNILAGEEKSKTPGGFLGGAGDVGKEYVSAIEIGTKMASRQLVFNITGFPAPDSLDDGNRCAAINEQAYQWAIQAASPAARQRHQEHGMPLRMAADVKPFPPAGPWWIWNYLEYKTNTTSKPTLDVASYYAFYSTSGLAYGAGNHYCKLLSPARAMEWIYTDSLKQTD